MISLTQLEYIVAVDQYRHFGKAAKAVHISQPTLSHQVQKLEDDLGVIIFDRLQKPIIPTEEGKRLLEQARVVLKEQQRLLHLARKKVGDVSGRFKLGIIPTVASHLLPLFIGDFSKQYPQVELFIEEMKTDSIIEALKTDQLDGAILATPLNESGLKEHPLYYEAFYLYLSDHHPLLKKQKISAQDLNENEMWLLQDGHCFKSQIAHFCSIHASHDTVFKNIHFQSGSLDALRTLVKKNHGYTMIPALMVEAMSDAEVRRQVRAFQAPVPTREISFVYRRDHWKLDIIRALEDTVIRSVPDSILHPEKARTRLIPPSG